MLLLSDLNELKALIEVNQDDPSEDIKLGLLIETASTWIQEILNRDFELKSRTEYYPGSGTQEMTLRHRPVLINPLPLVYEDDTNLGFYGSVPGSFDSTTQLVYGDDFALVLDNDINNTGIFDSSRSGILVRINQLWDKPVYRQIGLLSPFIARGYGNVKIVYTAGYTTDSLPAQIRTACAVLVSKLRNLLPYGSLLTSESYEERSVGYFIPNKRILLAEVWPMIYSYRNQWFGSGA